VMATHLVKHLSQESKFIITLTNPPGEAFLKYKTLSPGVLDYYSTFVPPEHRGYRPSIASLLGDTAMNYAKTENLKVRLSCEYLEKKYNNNEEYRLNILEDESKY